MHQVLPKILWDDSSSNMNFTAQFIDCTGVLKLSVLWYVSFHIIYSFSLYTYLEPSSVSLFYYQRNNF